MSIKDTTDKTLLKVLDLVKTIRPDSTESLAKVGAYFIKHLKEDFGSYEFEDYLDYIEKQLVYEQGVINLGVLMQWGKQFSAMKSRTWTQTNKEIRDNFYNDTTH